MVTLPRYNEPAVVTICIGYVLACNARYMVAKACGDGRPGDNDIATNTAKGTVSSKRTKHWDLYLHMNKQRVRDGTTEPDRVPSPDNNSDVGTKCQNDPDYLRLTPRLKGYAESYIPPEYNLLMGPLTDHAFG